MDKEIVADKIKESSIKYAKGFDIYKDKDKTILEIKSPFKGAKESFIYEIKKDTNLTATDAKKTISVPVKTVILTSTTHIPMVELLGDINSIVGFPYTRYVSSEVARKRIDADYIKEIGNENALNTEIILDLNPDVIIGYSVSSPNKSLSVVEKSGIDVIYNGDWLEETPLGRAEWIKFFGLLYNKEKEADSIFRKIERDYKEAINIANNNQKAPTVLSGAIMSNDLWNLPAGESFVAQFLKDANLNYLWEDTKGNGSLSLSFESVFDKGANADFWIAPGYFTSKNQMIENNSLYEKFKAFRENKIFTPSTKQGATGGILYYELAPARPDLVLKDIIKITQPELLPDYELTFFEKMK